MMSDTPFSPEMRRALDGFAPPPPAPGFADRALERVRARDAAPPLPKPLRRWRSASPWRRAGVIVGALASVSLVSAAAAATGVFGEPVEVPVLSPLARSLDMVPAPVKRRAPPVQAAVAPAAPPQPGVSTARERIDTLIDDPGFRALPPVERRAELRRTARDIVASGEARPVEVRAALRDTTRERLANMTPEQREKLAEAVAQRREALAGTTPAERRQARRQALRERRSEALAQGAAPVADDGTGGSGE